ncbi:MAG: hypothetical protein FD131_4165 [Rhodocyclaceae bacterium]|nr:MAG: hypothetical protein FD131_4165 [Rhodocyclaceae bacterium]
MATATCIGCGCTDTRACWDETADQPCHWLVVDYRAGLGVCSVCPDDLSRWENGDRTIAVPVEQFMNETVNEGSLEFALEEATEGIEILDQLIASIRQHGNYSKEATLTFLGQARQCFNALQRHAE